MRRSTRDIDALVASVNERAQLAHILDLFWEESWRSIYAGELEVRPPGPPSTGPDTGERGLPLQFPAGLFEVMLLATQAEPG